MENKTKEINEAIIAGNDVLKVANEVLRYLDGASTWGFIDMFSRGSLLSGVIKHSKMNRAEEAMNDLRYSIDRFNAQLSDVKIFCEVSYIDFDGFMRFIDIFCDNFFIDFLAVSRISDSKSRIKSLINEVTNIVDKLGFIN